MSDPDVVAIIRGLVARHGELLRQAREIEEQINAIHETLVSARSPQAPVEQKRKRGRPRKQKTETSSNHVDGGHESKCLTSETPIGPGTIPTPSDASSDSTIVFSDDFPSIPSDLKR